MNREFYTLQEIQEAAAYIKRQVDHRPGVGLVLGSGLSPLAQDVTEATRVPYRDIPHFPVSGVAGHAGQLVIGTLAGQKVLVMQGRVHYYEGYSMQHITLPIRAMQALGVKTLILTNAAGGLNPAFKAGDLMLITDTINLIGMTGHNPLRGPNIDQLGPRFPDMSEPFDLALQARARAVAAQAGFTLREGVYICLAGPNFETPADIRFLRSIGADAVGMSTVPEMIVARHGGMQVLGLSAITNVAITETTPDKTTTHEEVLETGKLIAPQLMALLKGILAALD
jgi:purine-nucleoside phosphorylase